MPGARKVRVIDDGDPSPSYQEDPDSPISDWEVAADDMTPTPTPPSTRAAKASKAGEAPPTPPDTPGNDGDAKPKPKPSGKGKPRAKGKGKTKGEGARQTKRSNDGEEKEVRHVQYGFGTRAVDKEGNVLELTQEELEAKKREEEELKNRKPTLEGQPVKMTPWTYSKSVADLKSKKRNRVDGSGTKKDPEIIWLCPVPEAGKPRFNGIIKICREACKIKNTKRLWIRKLDHSTTRKIEHTASDSVDVTYTSDDPHITVYMGDSEQYEFDGHLYCNYYEDYPGIIKELGRPRLKRSDPRWEELVVALLPKKILRDKALLKGYLE